MRVITKDLYLFIMLILKADLNRIRNRQKSKIYCLGILIVPKAPVIFNLVYQF